MWNMFAMAREHWARDTCEKDTNSIARDAASWNEQLIPSAQLPNTLESNIALSSCVTTQFLRTYHSDTSFSFEPKTRFSVLLQLRTIDGMGYLAHTNEWRRFLLIALRWHWIWCQQSHSFCLIWLLWKTSQTKRSTLIPCVEYRHHPLPPNSCTKII